MLSLTCLSACNGALFGRTEPFPVTVEKQVVIIPEDVPEDLMAVPPCPEVDEITWGDARSASDHYRRCKDLRGQRIEDLGHTVRGRWDWLREQAKGVEKDNAEIIERAKDGETG